MNKKVWGLSVLLVLVLVGVTIYFTVYKPYQKNRQTDVSHIDTTSAQGFHPQNSINLPHADTSLIPVLSKVLEEAFDASIRKDYAALAAFIVYRGIDSTRFGYDVFSAKNNYERNVLRITGAVFNKWNSGIDSRDYARVFQMDQPDGRKLIVLEVIFVSKKNVDRKFFGFLQIKNKYKIADVTSYL